MDESALRRLLGEVRSGTVAPDDAVAALRRLPYEDLGFAQVDHHRNVRQGMPEAVYGPGKAPEHVAAIVGELLVHGHGPVLVTRVDDAQATAALGAHPGGQRIGATLVWRPTEQSRDERVVIATAGTADLPIADECATVLQAHGFRPTRVSDVGVAGVHRLFPHVSALQDADVVVVVAGMEGALASVVGGLTAAPVVAVPTSVGYGSSFEGVTALLAMLSSCASGVTVVGIDNGFGAACAVARLTRASRRYRDLDRDPG
ncbi:MAG: nickel pincer cofactor biosynthesis protein LarB [Acidimicrobiia bacterium]